MKFRIDGTIDGEPAWIEWDNGKVTGSDWAVQLLKVKSSLVGERRVHPESFYPFDGEWGDPYRVLWLCIATLYGHEEVFDEDPEPQYDLSEIVAASPKIPPGAVS